MSFPYEIRKNPIWCLYDNMAGQIILKHPFWSGLAVPCPHCSKTLRIDNYKAVCCGYTFRTGFGEIAQREPYGQHKKTDGRGWKSLRPFVRGMAT